MTRAATSPKLSADRSHGGWWRRQLVTSRPAAASAHAGRQTVNKPLSPRKLSTPPRGRAFSCALRRRRASPVRYLRPVLVVRATPRRTAKAGMLPVRKYNASRARLVTIGLRKPVPVLPQHNVQTRARRRRRSRLRSGLGARGRLRSGLGECARGQCKDRYGDN